jgi:hypothetical protein
MYWTLFWTLGLRANEQPNYEIHYEATDANKAEEDKLEELYDYPDAEVWVEACYE